MNYREIAEMAMQTRNIINANGAVITRAIVLAALAKSNLHWEMHHAQVYALECQVFIEPPTVVETEVTQDIVKEL